MTKVLGVTLARGGSKGVPRKNIRPIAGKPLLAYTIEEALKCTLITEYVVSSDDKDILVVAFQYGANVVERPAELAQDDTPHLPALIHALDWAEDAYNTLSGAVLLFKGMSPDPEIKELLDKINVSFTDSSVTIAFEITLSEIEQLLETFQQ